MFLSAQELTIISRDFQQVLAGAEATPATLSYIVSATPGLTDIDKAFDRDNGPAASGRKTLAIKAIQEHVKPRSLKLLSVGYIEVGDCIFYFSKSVNVKEPVAGFPILWESLRVIDPGSVVWKPKLLPTSVQARLAIQRLGTDQICQVLVCHPEA